MFFARIFTLFRFFVARGGFFEYLDWGAFGTVSGGSAGRNGAFVSVIQFPRRIL